MPESCEACQSQSQFRLVSRLCPLQRRTRIGQFLFQGKLCIAYSLLGPKVSGDYSCQASVIGGVPAPTLLLLPCLVQPGQGILSNQLQHGKGYDASGHDLRPDETGIDQRGQGEERLLGGRLFLRPADCLRSLQRPASYEDAEGTKTALLLLREKLITPGNSVLHTLLAYRQVSGTATQKRQTMSKPLPQLR